MPLNDNYYNLLDDEVKKWQIQIARENGVYGFCFYHYWFGGKLMLQKPVEQYLENKELDFPFCLCWANPPWTRVWFGQGSTVLIDQDYGDENQWEEHFQYLLPYFKDERYIKENGKPLFVIYMPQQIPCLAEMIAFLRKRAIEEGFPGIRLAYQYYVDEKQFPEIRPQFDYCIRFQPICALEQRTENAKSGPLVDLVRKADSFIGKVFKFTPSDKLLKLRKYDYDAVWETILADNVRDKDIPCAFVNFDNTPRRGNAGKVMIGASPEKFEYYLRQMKKKIDSQYSTDYLFITAWNEWSEGAYLEPDKRNGLAYLNAIGGVFK